MTRILFIVSSLILGFSTLQSLATAATFRGLGDLPGGGFRSEVQAVSADGHFVVGFSANEDSVQESFLWSLDNGMTALGFLTGDTGSVAEGVSADGRVVVGYSYGQGSVRPFRWTPGAGMDVLAPGAEQAFAWDVTADGQIIVGGFGANTLIGGPQEAFRWTTAGMYQFLGFLPGSTSSTAFSVSADGSVLVGAGVTMGQIRALRWSAATGMVDLGDLPGPGEHSRAHGVSANGQVIVGESNFDVSAEAFRWTQASGMVDLGDLPGGASLSAAYAASADGSIVVGTSAPEGPLAAFIWDAAHGMRSLQSVLVSDYGLDLTGWNLGVAIDISDDGMTIVGTGTNPDGNIEGWIATIPEPHSLVYALCAVIVALACRRVRQKRGQNTSPLLAVSKSEKSGSKLG